MVASSVGYRSVTGLGPGLRMLAVLERQVVAEVPDREVVERIQAWKALKSRVEAGMIDELLEFAWRRRCDPTAPVGVRLPAVEEFAADELAPALTLSPRTARGWFERLITLADRLPRVMAAMRAGHIDEKKGVAIFDETAHLSGGVGEIDGLGFVPAWVARNLVADLIERKGTGFRAVVFDENTGTFLAASSPSYRLPADLERHIKHRDRTCRFPGCRQPATWCDIDHVRPWLDGGPTADCNLACLCRRHHRLKQTPAWRVAFDDGVSTWTTRTGHTYTTHPHDYRQPEPPAARHEDEPSASPADLDDTGPPDTECGES